MEIKESNNLRKNFIWNIIGTTFTAFNSLFFLIVVTRVNGVDKAGIFTFAFALSLLFYAIGIYSGRTYQVTESEKKISDGDYFYHRIITCILMFTVTLVFVILQQYSIYTIGIILILMLWRTLEAFSEYSYAIMQTRNKLYLAGQSLFFKAIGSLILFVVINIITQNLILSSLMIVLVNILVILFFDILVLRKMKLKIGKINKKHVMIIFKKGFYTFAFLFLTVYIINAPRYAIDNIMALEAQTIFGILIMPATVLILMGQFIIQPFLVELKNKISENNITAFRNLALKMILGLSILGVLAIIGAWFLGIPILELVYGISLSDYHVQLIIILIGATSFGITVILSHCLIVMRHTLSQLIVFAACSVIIFILSNQLVTSSGINGAVLSYMITMLILVLSYLVLFFYSIKKYRGENNE